MTKPDKTSDKTSHATDSTSSRNVTKRHWRFAVEWWTKLENGQVKRQTEQLQVCTRCLQDSADCQSRNLYNLMIAHAVNRHGKGM
mmetsp:Transcript_50023/g.93557  ORF Transcript_50023/g.93557 Transcript_50023/m.93557 type:complete len:85 (-) Transcript_50023:56-310(-)